MWPPTVEDFKNIANTVLNDEKLYKDKTEIKSLVYWDNSDIIIIDPIHFANTEYEEMSFRDSKRNRTVAVIIGKED